MSQNSLTLKKELKKLYQQLKENQDKKAEIKTKIEFARIRLAKAEYGIGEDDLILDPFAVLYQVDTLLPREEKKPLILGRKVLKDNTLGKPRWLYENWQPVRRDL